MNSQLLKRRISVEVIAECEEAKIAITAHRPWRIIVTASSDSVEFKRMYAPSTSMLHTRPRHLLAWTSLNLCNGTTPELSASAAWCKGPTPSLTPRLHQDE